MSIMTDGGGKGGIDSAAAVTRSLLGWGAVVGPFYLAVGLTLALTRPGFDLANHPLSLLMLGEGGWMQATNIILSGVMVLAAAVGFARAMGDSKAGTRAGVLLGGYGVCLVLSGIFPPGPMKGFPASAAQAGTVSGILHMAFGAIGFLALAGAAFVVGGWSRRRGDRSTARYSRISGAVVVVGFLGGAALSAFPLGVAFLWVAVVVGWAWLLVTSLRAYRGAAARRS